MPYIEQSWRDDVDGPVDELVHRVLKMEQEFGDDATDGIVNYIITRLVHGTLARNPRYANYARAVAALECAKLEFYARQARPYEDIKAMQNGDVYG